LRKVVNKLDDEKLDAKDADEYVNNDDDDDISSDDENEV
jgi:hypothetical protein